MFGRFSFTSRNPENAGKKADPARQKARRKAFDFEKLEDRLVMTGPQLVSIIPNSGDLLRENDTLNVAPRELTLRFNEGQAIDAASLSGIRIVGSGFDDVFEGGRNIPDGATLLVTDATSSVRFEFDKNGILLTGNTAVAIQNEMTPGEVAQALATAINGSALQSVTANVSGNTINLTGATGLVVDPATGLQQQGTTSLTVTGNTYVVNPGFIGIGDRPNEVVVRFAQPLADDRYEIQVTGEGSSPLRNLGGETFITNTVRTEVRSTNVPRPVQEGAPVTSTLSVAQSIDIAGVSVELNITHADSSDLQVFLVSPSQTRVELFSNVGAGGANFTNTVLDDGAAVSISAGTAPFTGVFRPVTPLSTFAGENSLGNWTLEIIDSAIGNVGTLDNWSLTFVQGEPNETIPFELDLAAQVIAIDPQPITRNGQGRLQQAANQIVVYFNNDNLDLVSAQTPAFYQLINTQGTLTPADDVLLTPNDPIAPVVYDPAADRATLTFANPIPRGTYQLRIGNNDPLPVPPVTMNVAVDLGNSSFDTSTVINDLSAPILISASIDPEFYGLQLPGGINEPGHRDIPPYIETHLLQNSDQEDGIATAYYNFQLDASRPGVYGFDPQGNALFNAMTDIHRQRVREIFELYGHFLGIQFVETTDDTVFDGITVALGDPRALDPTAPTGPGGLDGIILTGLNGVAVIDAAENFGQSEYGGLFFRTAMEAVGHSLNLGDAQDLPSLTIMGDRNENDPATFPSGELVFPGDHDIVHGQFLYRPESKDIDLYTFNANSPGWFNAEAIAERLGDSSLLDSVLTLYNSLNILQTPSQGGAGLIDGQTFDIFDGVNTVRFEFDSNSNLVNGTAVRIPFLVSDSAARLAGAVASAINNSQLTTGIALNVVASAVGNRVELQGPVTVTNNSGLAATVRREVVASNDDYFSDDSFLRLRLNPGRYFLAVTSKGNTSFDPNIVDSGFGGTTQGRYDLRLNFTPDAAATITDATGVAFDGDADGKAGGVYNFWFQANDSGANALSSADDNTIYVDKANIGNTTGADLGTLTNPYRDIDDALTAAANSANRKIVRVVGNGGADGNVATLGDNLTYQIGLNNFNQTLQDGRRVQIPRDVTLMIDGGAVLKMFDSNIDIGSDSALVNRSGGALQVLGTPGESVVFTSFRNDAVGGDQDGASVGARPGDWGGLVFRADSDREGQGIFLNYINHATVEFGGRVSPLESPIHLIEARPTISHNLIRNSSDHAISADPDSFEETLFAAYDRVGPHVHGNTLIDNGINGLFVRIRTPFGNSLDRLETSARFDDADIVHVISENLIINGTPGGPVLQGGTRSTHAEVEPNNTIATAQNLDGLFILRSNPLIDDATGDISQTIPHVTVSARGDNTFDYYSFTVPAAGGRGIFDIDLGNTGFTGSLDTEIFLYDTAGNLLASNNDSAIFDNGSFLFGDSFLEFDFPITPLATRYVIGVGRFDSTGAPGGITGARPQLGESYTLHVSLDSAPVVNAFDGTRVARLDGRLAIDPGVVVKMNGARIEIEMGGQLIAEGTEADPVLFTSLRDDGYGGSGTADTNGDRSSLIRITEIGLAAPNFLEIQNLAGELVDTSGWRVAVSNNPLNINSADPITFTLPQYMTAGQAFVRSDDPANPNYVGTDINWSSGANGWVMLLDENGTVVDWTGWGWTAQQINSFNVTVNGRTINGLSGHWSGAGVTNTGVGSMQRQGARDTNAATDFLFITPSSPGDQNAGLASFQDPNSVPVSGDWSGIIANATSQLSLDHTTLQFAGGESSIAGGFDFFNPIEIHQAEARITNSTFQNNDNGLALSGRDGRGLNEAAVIFVRGAQPVIVGNIIRTNLSSDSDNRMSAISINVNSLNAESVRDLGRSTGAADRFSEYADNRGPLVRANRLDGTDINGMVVRGGELTTESVWDDTDIVHVVFDEITSDNFHTYGGLKLQSSANESLVVKFLGDDAGLTASGVALDIDDRIGGSVQVLGTPGHPVVMTSLNDCTVGAGLTPDGQPQTETLNGICQIGTVTSVPFVDVLVVMDESASMGFAQQFSIQLIADLEAGLVASGVGNGVLGVNQYGLIGYGGSPFDNEELGHPHPVGPAGALMGSAAEYGVAAQSLVVSGAIEDGFEAIQFALRTYPVRQQGKTLVLLVTNEDRDIVDATANFNNTLAALNATNASLQVIVSATFTDGAGTNALALDALGNAFLEDGAGGFTTSPGGTVQFAFGTTETDYINMAFATGGIAGDIFQIQAGGLTATSFSAAMVTSIVGQVAGQTAGPGDWRSLEFDGNSNDRNVQVINEIESSFTGGNDINDGPGASQFLGNLAPHEFAGDENRRLGFVVNGYISENDATDIDVYSFSANPGTEVWFDIDRTTHSLDTVIELIDETGVVLARSDANNQLFAGTFNGQPVAVLPIQKDSFLQARFLGEAPTPGVFLGEEAPDPFDLYTTNPRDAGMRVILPGPAGLQTPPTYYVRVRSNPQPVSAIDNLEGGLTRGAYQLQVRLREVDEIPGSTVRFADIRFAGTGIDIQGLPGHSPLVGETGEANSGTGNEGIGNAQPLGNLLNADRNTISVAGDLNPNLAADVDWYEFQIDYDLVEAFANFSNGIRTFATMFDIDYADGLARPDLTISVFDQNGNLIYVGRDSDIEDDQPLFGQGLDSDDLSRGSFGKLDPYLGTVQLPAGLNSDVGGATRTYRVAISSNAQLPTALNQTFTAGSGSGAIRLEPINSVNRIAEDHIGQSGYTNNGVTPPHVATASTQPLFGQTGSSFNGGLALNAHATPFTLQDVVLFISTGNQLHTVDPFTGALETNFPGGSLNVTTGGGVGDITMRSDGFLHTLSTGNNDGNSGNLIRINTGAGGVLTNQGDDGVGNNTVRSYDALAFRFDASNGGAQNGFALYAVSNNTGVPRLYRLDPNTGANLNAFGGTANPAPVDTGLGPVSNATGFVRGLAFDRFDTTLFAVDDAGNLLNVDIFSGASSTVRSNVTGTGVGLTGLTLGPENVEAGRYADLLFATGTDGRLYAFDYFGNLQPIFAGNTTSVAIGTFSANGLAFSTLDYNLWHPTDQRGGNIGHGYTFAPDESRDRIPLLGENQGSAFNTSFYFGLEHNTADDPSATERTLVNQPNSRDYRFTNAGIYNSYDLPGGAQGSLVTNPFSLQDYTATDKPTLYFNYFLATQGASTAGNLLGMRDSFRVFVSDDGVNWSQVTTNNSVLSSDTQFGGTIHELPEHLASSGGEYSRYPGEDVDHARRRRIQEAFDNTGEWRQVRVDLGDFAGRDNLQFRFDFSTAGDTNTPLTIAAVPGSELTDGNVFTLSHPFAGQTTFEFDSNGVFNGANVQIPFTAGDSVDAVAAAIADAINNAPGFQGGGFRTTASTKGWLADTANLTDFRSRHLVTISNVFFGTEETSAFGFSTTLQNNSSPLAFSNPGQFGDYLPGDSFGNFDDTNAAIQRGQANNFEGLYIDDIVVGFAERGEMVTNSDGTGAGFFTVPQNPDPNAPTEVLVGPYQLEIRRGTEYAVSEDRVNSRIILTDSFDTNDRLASGFTLEAPSGASLSDGERMRVSDGVNSAVFEFDSNGTWDPANIRIQIAGNDTPAEVASMIASAINSAAIDVTATSILTSNRVNLVGATVVELLSVPLDLSVSINGATVVDENAGLLTAKGTVTREVLPGVNPLTLPALTVTLTAQSPFDGSASTQVTIPATVTIPAGSLSVDFDITVVDDAFLDGTQTVLFRAAAPGFNLVTDALDVLDNETAVLTLTIGADSTPDTIMETAGPAAIQGRVELSVAPGADFVVSLVSTDPTEASVPTQVTIPAGVLFTTFFVGAVDDVIIDGTQTLSIVAFADGLSSSSEVLFVDDVAGDTVPPSFAAGSLQSATSPSSGPSTANLFNASGFLTGPSSASAESIANQFLAEHHDQLGLTEADLRDVRITDNYTTAHNGVTHVYFQQYVDGLEVINGAVNFNIMADGRILSVGNRFAADTERSINTLTPSISALQAVRRVAQDLGITLTTGSPGGLEGTGRQQLTVFQFSELSTQPIEVQLKLQPEPDGDVRLVWSLGVQQVGTPDQWDYAVDAVNQQILGKVNRTHYASYNVFAHPLEHPNDGPRTVLVDPHDPVASPFGWHDTNGVPGAEFLDTRGNNVFAFEGRDCTFAQLIGGTCDPNTHQRANGGPTLNFDFPLNLANTPDTYIPAAITNLFYAVNVNHDIHAAYGFDEASGNFQFRNYSGLGLGNDQLLAVAQAGAQAGLRDNAFYSHRSDGTSPTINMFLWDLTNPERDGDFDNLIIAHEFGHGVSLRLTGGASSPNVNLATTQSAGMGEGWSDFWGTVFTLKPTDTATGSYTGGTYVLGQPPTGPGIRRFPYNTNMAVNPLTFNDIDPNQIDVATGPGAPADEVHNVGEIWAVTLLDAYWDMVAQYGYDPDLINGTGGNNMFLQLVTDGLKLQPANPTFLEARDAILQADIINNGGVNVPLLWRAFARRGMGLASNDAGNSNFVNVFEAFNTPGSLQVDIQGPTVVTEGDPNPVTTARISRNGTVGNLLVNLSSSRPAQADFVQSTVTIPDGQSFVDVPIAVFDDNLADGTQTVFFGASSTWFNTIVDTVDILDDDGAAQLTVFLSGGFVPENSGTLVGQGFVARNTAVDEDLVVTLVSHDSSEITVPPSVTIPAGSNFATFDITVVDEFFSDGLRFATILAAAPGVLSGEGTIGVDAVSSVEFYDRLGDRNLHRDQGVVLIESNIISDSDVVGINVGPDNRDAGSNTPHPGAARNLTVINNGRLTPGAVIQNNLIVASGQAGIRFAGDAVNAGQPVAAVPYGRIVNNTIFGTVTPSGVGIDVGQNASPTILNNIISNTNIAIRVDATSSSTVVGTSLFKDNTNTPTLGTFPIVLGPNDPLFINAAGRNFYLADGADAVDSSLNQLDERASLVAVITPLGIAESPILAPDRDLIGQARVDDPTQDPPPGLGSNVFKDRGALERSDFFGPTVNLINPEDNDNAGIDLDLDRTEVLVNGDVILTQFTLQFNDAGAGIDDTTARDSNNYQIFADLDLDGVLDDTDNDGIADPLVLNTDYLFSYDATNNVVRFTAVQGIYDSGTYRIVLDNSLAGIRDLAQNQLQPNQVTGETQFTIVYDSESPTATLIAPLDNDPAGNDADPAVDRVVVLNSTDRFVIQLADGLSGIDDDSVLNMIATDLRITYDVPGTGTTEPLDRGEEFSATYDQTTNQITIQVLPFGFFDPPGLTAFPFGRYQIELGDGLAGGNDVFDNAGNILRDNDLTVVIRRLQIGTVPAVTEGDTVGGTYSVVLGQQPLSNVVVSLTNADGQVTAFDNATMNTTRNTFLVFTPSNWNIPQFVRVIAVDDAIDEATPHTGVIIHTISSNDNTFNGLTGVVSITINDNDTADILISQTANSTSVSEDGAVTDTYTVQLASRPTANVVVSLTNDGQVNAEDLNQAGSTFLVFTPANWNVAQTVRVTAVDDGRDEAITHLGVITHTGTSLDPLYNARVRTLNVNVTDNDTFGVTLTQSSGQTDVTEGGTGDSYNIVLNSQPSGNVTVTLNADNQVTAVDNATPSNTFLVFTPANWNVPQIVRVNAANDNVDEADPHPGVISHVLTSTDPQYDGLPLASVVARVFDNDVARIVVTETAATTSISEAGLQDTFNVVLSTQPTSDVVILLSTDDQTDAVDAANPANAFLIFTPLNWNVAQTVRVTATDDQIAEGTHTGNIDLIGTSNDPIYANQTARVVANIADNDAASLVIVQTNNSTDVVEGGVPATDTYTIALSSRPTSNVLVTLNPTPGTQLLAEDQSNPGATSILFTPNDWNIPRVVRVTAIDDNISEANPHTAQVVHTVVSNDSFYNSLNVPLNVRIFDNDAVGITVIEDGSIDVTEGGSGGTSVDRYLVLLRSQPSGIVQINLATDGQTTAVDDANPTNQFLIFTPQNWNIAQTVRVTAVNDSIQETDPHFSSITHTAASSDANYNGLVRAVTANVFDNDSPGITITQSGTTDVFEGGATDTFSVVLTSQPTANVTIVLNPDTQVNAVADANPGSSVLVFTAANWNVPQLVRVSAADDNLAEASPHAGSVGLTAQSADPIYNNLTRTVNVNVFDNDAPAILVTQSGLSTDVTEAGGTDTVTVVLATQPAADVLVNLAGDSQVTARNATTNVGTLLFTPANWNVPQTVRVSAIDDVIDESDFHAGTVTLTATSADANYQGETASFTANVADNDIAGITIAQSGASTDVSEDGAVDTYTIVLDTQPTGDVTIALAPNAQLTAINAANNGSQVVFTPANWNVAQTVRVGAVDDQIDENATHPGFVDNVASSNDQRYTGRSVRVNANVADNDTANIVYNESNGSTDVTEGGADDIYTVVLSTQPTASVQIFLNPNEEVSAVNDATFGQVLTFTAGNWNIPQVVRVTAIDDADNETDVHAGAVVHTVLSGDPNYNGRAHTVSVNVTDNEVADLTINVAGAINVAEGDFGGVIYSVVLTSTPAFDVMVNLSAGNQISAVSANNPLQTFLVFTPANWSVPQNIRVTAIDDSIDEGIFANESILHTLDSKDVNFHGITKAVQVTVTDNDTAGVTVSQSGGSTRVTEGGAGDSYTIRLDSQPTQPVIFTLDADAAQLGVSPTSLTFDATNWNIPQTVSVQAIDDVLVEGLMSEPIGHSILSGDPLYSSIAVPNVLVEVTDDDVAPAITGLQVENLGLSSFGGNSVIRGRFTSNPNTTFQLQFLARQRNGATGVPIVNTLTVTTDATGSANFVVPINNNSLNGEYLDVVVERSGPGGPRVATLVTGLIGPNATSMRAFLSEAFNDLLNRDATLQQMQSLETTGQSRLQLISAITAGAEFDGLTVREIYNQILNRTPTATELSGGISLLQSGSSNAELRALLFNTNEYFTTQAGGTTSGYVNAVYQDLLGRAPTATETNDGVLDVTEGGRQMFAENLQAGAEFQNRLINQLHQRYLGRDATTSELTSYRQQLATGGSEDGIVNTIVSSVEYFGQQVTESVHLDYLDRVATAAEIAAGKNFFTSGGSEIQFRAQVLGSLEYFQKAGSTNALFVEQAYLEVLGRQPTATEIANGVAQVGTSSRVDFALTLLNLPEAIARISGVSTPSGSIPGPDGGLFADDFNRTNSSDLGANWTEQSGDFVIQTNELLASSTSTALATANGVSVSDVTAQANITLAPSIDSHAGIVLRSSGSNMYLGAIVRVNGGLSAQIWRNVAGNWEMLGSAPINSAVGVVNFSAIGNVLTLSFNGSIAVQVTDSAIGGNGTVGLRGMGGTRYDNFTASQATSSSATLPFSDAFNTGTSLSSSWIRQAGQFAIQSGRAAATQSGLNIATADLQNAADVSVSADVSLPTGQTHAGVLARYSGSGDGSTAYLGALVNDGSTNSVMIWRNLAGTWTMLSDAVVASNAGTLRFDVVGNSLQLFFNGTLATSTTDTAITAAGKVGIRSVAGATFDNFNATVGQPTQSIPGLTIQAGGFQQNGSLVVATSSGINLATKTDPAQTNVNAQATVSVLQTGNSHAGVIARYSGSGDSNMYLGALVGMDGVFSAQIWKNVGGTWSLLTAQAVTSHTGTLRLSVQGNTLQLFVNNALVGSVTDGDIVGAGLVGIRGSQGTTFTGF